MVQKLDAASQSLMEEVTKDNRNLRTKIAQLETENVKLLQGIKEIRTQLKEGTLVPAEGNVDIPTLDKLVAVRTYEICCA